MQRRKILVTNDDSIHAPGLALLADIATGFGEVTVIAPSLPQSGMGHAVTVNNNIRVTPTNLFGSLAAYACSGTPVDCVKWAVTTLYQDQKPDLVLSGVNHGSNVAMNVLYSGTMSAAMEGALEHIPSIGFSFAQTAWNADLTPYKSKIHDIIQLVFEHSKEIDTLCFNVNIPDLPVGQIQGVRFCRQGFAFWKDDYKKYHDPSGHPYYWLAGEFTAHEQDTEDTDYYLLQQGFITIVPVYFDLTHHSLLHKMRDWSL